MKEDIDIYMDEETEELVEGLEMMFLMEPVGVESTILVAIIFFGNFFVQPLREFFFLVH